MSYSVEVDSSSSRDRASSYGGANEEATASWRKFEIDVENKLKEKYGDDRVWSQEEFTTPRGDELRFDILVETNGKKKPFVLVECKHYNKSPIEPEHVEQVLKYVNNLNIEKEEIFASIKQYGKIRGGVIVCTERSSLTKKAEKFAADNNVPIIKYSGKKYEREFTAAVRQLGRKQKKSKAKSRSTKRKRSQGVKKTKKSRTKKK